MNQSEEKSLTKKQKLILEKAVETLAEIFTLQIDKKYNKKVEKDEINMKNNIYANNTK